MRVKNGKKVMYYETLPFEYTQMESTHYETSIRLQYPQSCRYIDRQHQMMLRFPTAICVF